MQFQSALLVFYQAEGVFVIYFILSVELGGGVQWLKSCVCVARQRLKRRSDGEKHKTNASKLRMQHYKHFSFIEFAEILHCILIEIHKFVALSSLCSAPY